MRNRIPKLLALAGLIMAPVSGCLSGGTEIPNEVTGTIYAAGGTPAAHVAVTLYPVDYQPAGSAAKPGVAAAKRSTQTDASGKYRFRDVTPGAYNVLGAGGGGVAFIAAVSVTGGSQRLAADTLRPPGILTGTVRLRPLDDPGAATVQVLGTDYYAEAAADGRFSLALPQGSHRLRVTVDLPGYEPLLRTVAVASGVNDTLPVTLAPDDGAPAALYSYVTEVTDIDRDLETISTRERYWYCDEDEAVEEYDDVTRNYRIAGGELHLWGEDECRADVSRGPSTDIVGTWIADPPFLAEVPGAQCAEGEAEERALITGFARRAKVTDRITGDSVISTVSGEICLAEVYAWSFTEELDDLTITAPECSSVKMTRGEDGATGRIMTDMSGSTIQVAFVFDGETCSASFPITGSEPDCDEDPETEFFTCVYESGLLDGAGFKFAKQAKRKFHADLRKILRAAR